jgi:DNA-binding SARP family transcriptional activator
MEFRVLGPLEALDGGQAVKLGGGKQRALLAVLLLEANAVVSSDRLVDLLWGDEPPATAAHSIQVYVSNLRKAIGQERLRTRPPGYVLEVGPDELDLARFERLLDEGRRRLAEGLAEQADAMLREALDLWHGAPLADFAYEPFAQAAISRLDELRLSALEERIDADLACGRHAALVAELEALVREQPLRERMRGQLMLALYRAGRQAEALEVFQDARRTLVDELGIDPSPALQRLERSILQQDPALDLAARGAVAAAARPAVPARARPDRSILLAAGTDADVATLAALAEPLARSASPHELILARAVADPTELAAASSLAGEAREALVARGVPARAAAFTSADPPADLVRLAAEQDVALLLVAIAAPVAGGTLPAEIETLLADSPCDVGLVVFRADAEAGGAVLVPFGGATHDWAALELGAWLASAHGVPLRLLGIEATDGDRDASRLLAHAALSVQQLAGVATEPVLSPPGAAPVLAAAADARLLVAGLPEGRPGSIGADRSELAARSPVPVILVRRGLRPGGLAPGASLTRFTWSLGA